MARKKVVKANVEKFDDVSDIVDRKTYLRKKLIEHLEEEFPETDRKFNMYKVCELRHTRGSFRNFLNGDFKPEDKRIFREILQDLKVEKILLHVGGCGWARLK